MTARNDDLIIRVAAALSLEVVGIPAGGEFGAAFVRSASGEKLVLKATPGAAREAAWRHGAALAESLRRDGYPAPEYRGCGCVGDAVWSLQTVLPGAVPDEATAAHVRGLHDLAERHAGRAVGVNPPDTGEPKVERSIDGARGLQQHDATRAVGRHIESVLMKLRSWPLPVTDICHGDFHHRNFTAVGDEVGGVFDWEGASCGDWHTDLASLAFWARVASSHFTDDAAALAVAHAEAVCPPEALSLYTATLSSRALSFYVDFHPEWVEDVVDVITDSVVGWWT